MNLRLLLALLCVGLFSCEGKKEIQLPKATFSVLSEVQDHSPIYFFFAKKGKDTVVEVNRKNSISSTNWIFSIDKRLPLRLVIPQIQILQAKKASSAHKSETAQNYFAYANDSLQTLAFTPFTNVVYSSSKTALQPNFVKIEVTKNGNLLFDSKPCSIQEIKALVLHSAHKIQLSFDASMNFETYLRTKLMLEKVCPNLLSDTQWIY